MLLFVKHLNSHGALVVLALGLSRTATQRQAHHKVVQSCSFQRYWRGHWLSTSDRATPNLTLERFCAFKGLHAVLGYQSCTFGLPLKPEASQPD